MKLLLDTHTFLWLINELYSSKLSKTVKKLFLNQENHYKNHIIQRGNV